MKSAKLIIGDDCFRNCNYCVLKCKSVLNRSIQIATLAPIRNFDSVNLIGNEPLTEPKRTLKIIEVLKALKSDIKIYLHTARYSVEMINLLHHVSGVTFYLHSNANAADLVGFMKMQVIVGRYPEKSNRLYIHPEVTRRVPVKPILWDSITSKDWVKEKDFKLSEGSSLFKLNIP